MNSVEQVPAFCPESTTKPGLPLLQKQKPFVLTKLISGMLQWTLFHLAMNYIAKQSCPTSLLS